jgi:hypothetical protein
MTITREIIFYCTSITPDLRSIVRVFIRAAFPRFIEALMSEHPPLGHPLIHAPL